MKKKGLDIELSLPRRKVIKLQAYYKKGKRWYKVGKII